MSDGIRMPRFQLEKVYADGSREEPRLHELTGIDATCRMGRRGFLLTSAVGMGALAAFSTGCASGSAQPKAQPESAVNPAPFLHVKPSAPLSPPDLPRTGAPKVHGLIAHKNDIQFLAFSQDGETLFTAAYDGTLKLWSVSDGKLQKTFGAQSFALAADGKTLITCYSGGTVKIWYAPFAAADLTIDTDIRGFGHVALSPDGKMMAFSTLFGIQLRSLPSGNVFATLKHAGKLTFSPDGAVLACHTMGEEVWLWSVPSGNLLARLNLHADQLAFSPDGTLLGFTTWGVLQLKAMPSGDVKTVLDMNCNNAPIAFSPDGKWLAVGTESTGILLMPAPFSRPVLRLDGHEQYVRNLAFSKDSRFLAVGTTMRTSPPLSNKTGIVYIWEMTGSGKTSCVLKAVLYDTSIMWENISVRYGVTSEKTVYIGHYNDPLPKGATCTCNSVAGRVSVRDRSCRCDKICTCVPVK